MEERERCSIHTGTYISGYVMHRHHGRVDRRCRKIAALPPSPPTFDSRLIGAQRVPTGLASHTETGIQIRETDTSRTACRTSSIELSPDWRIYRYLYIIQGLFLFFAPATILYPIDGEEKGLISITLEWLPMHDDSTVDTQLSIGIKGGCLCVRIMKPGLEFNSVDVGCIVDERGATCFFFVFFFTYSIPCCPVLSI
jgi:hypothetical protein